MGRVREPLFLKFLRVKKLVKVRVETTGAMGAFIALSFLFSVLFSNLYLSGALVAYSAEKSSIIESISITFKTEYGEQEEIPMPEITTSNKDLTIQDVEYMRSYDLWEPGVKIRVNITVYPEEGKYFPNNINRSMVKVKGAEFSQAHTNSDEEGSATIVCTYTPICVLGNTAEAGWNASHTTAVWKKVPFAPGYQLELYADDKKVKSYKNIKSTFLDLSLDMKDPSKYYYYEVKAVPLTSEEKKYLKEGQFVTSKADEVEMMDSDDVEDSTAAIVYGQGGNGVSKNAWRYMDKKWYYIDENGKVVKGWLHLDGKWYYMDGNGAMCTGWKYVGNGTWCYFSGDGSMHTNSWIQTTPGSWYYVGPQGFMVTGWHQDPDTGKTYYFDPETGRMHTGWFQEDGKWYYFHEQDGSMAIGWLQVGLKMYYFRNDGVMLMNTEAGGYHFGSDGALIYGKGAASSSGD